MSRLVPPAQVPLVKAERIKCTFRQFFGRWVQDSKWKVPKFHLDIIDFLADHKNWDNCTGVLSIFRGAGKSTIVGLFIVWMLTQDPTLKFLILSADKKTATKITRAVRRIIQKHEYAKHLLEDQDGAWQVDKIEVAGCDDDGNPSVTSWGIGSNVTGSRADWIIYDDCEVPKNSSTAGEREGLREKLDEPTHIIVPYQPELGRSQGFELFVGTPHSHESIYDELNGPTYRETCIRAASSVLRIPIMTNCSGEWPNIIGTPTWQARFPLKEILKRQKSSKTRAHFLSQYLLEAWNPDDGGFDTRKIIRYDLDVIVRKDDRGHPVATIGDTQLVGVTAFWDPAMNKQRGDASVLAIIFSDLLGNYFIHRTVDLDGSPQEQCLEAITILESVHCERVIIETNGVGAAFPAIFREHAGIRQTKVKCVERNTSMNKASKIETAYETPLYGGFLHAHASVFDTKFIEQLRDFNPKKMHKKNDFIDAVASALHSEPFRLKAKPGLYREENSWNSLSEGFEVQMDPVEF